MKVLLGTDTGLLKVVAVEQNAQFVVFGQSNTPIPEESIQHLVWHPQHIDKECFAATKGGSVLRINIAKRVESAMEALTKSSGKNSNENGEIEEEEEEEEEDGGESEHEEVITVAEGLGTIVGMEFFDHGDDKILMIASANGAINLLKLENIDELIDNEGDCLSPVVAFNAGPIAFARVCAAVPEEKLQSHTRELEAKLALRVPVVLTGGDNNDLKMWRLDNEVMQTVEQVDDEDGNDEATTKAAIKKPNPVFAAKNLPHDRLQLQVPVKPRDAVRLPDGRLVVAGEMGHVRVYNPTIKRRPVNEIDTGKAPLRKMALYHASPRYVTCGGTKGNCFTIDVTKGVVVAAYKGITASVRGLEIMPATQRMAVREGHQDAKQSEALMCIAGLERTLRIFTLQKRQQLHRFYVKQQISALLNFAEEPYDDLPKRDGADNEANQLPSERRKRSKRRNSVDDETAQEEFEEIWDSLKRNTAKSKTKRARKAPDAQATKAKKKKAVKA
eukprot:Clim_evm49s157 gene=Clim_evmTU49s157